MRRSQEFPAAFATLAVCAALGVELPASGAAQGAAPADSSTATPADSSAAAADSTLPVRAPGWSGQLAPASALLAERLRIAGTVLVEALVDENGRLRSTNVLRSQPLLDDAAVRAVEGLRFTPGLRGGRPALATIVIPVRFEPFANSPQADAHAEHLCQDTEFELELEPRPDSTGRFAARWRAHGLKSEELRLVFLFPDGLDVDTTGSWTPQRLVDDPKTAGWPCWYRDGKELRRGTEGAFSFRVPEEHWWESSRVAAVALFRNLFDDQTVARQLVFEIEGDAMGPLLVRDPGVPTCAGGPYPGLQFSGRGRAAPVQR